MVFRRGQKVEVYQSSKDESWEAYMDRFVGLHGIITDPDTAINDPDALVEVSLEGVMTIKLDCVIGRCRTAMRLPSFIPSKLLVLTPQH